MWIKTEEGIFNSDQIVSIWEDEHSGETMATDQTEAAFTISKNLVLSDIFEALKNRGEGVEVS